VAVLPPGASYEQFAKYVVDLHGSKTRLELAELWEWRQKLFGIRIDTGRALRAQLPPDEQHLTRDQRGAKVAQEAKAAGRNIERLPDKVYF
jgi:hypothetical protein